MIALVLAASVAVAAVPERAPVPAIGPAVDLVDHAGGPLPANATFTDSTGATVQLGDYIGHGRPVVLVLAYARCRMLCSVVLRAAGDAIRTSRHAAGTDFTPLVISLDPRETPDEASRRQATLLDNIGHSTERAAWPYLVGDDEQIHRVANAVGFTYAWDARTEQYAHPAAIFVITSDGRVAQTLRGVSFDGLDVALDRAAKNLITPDVAGDLLRCFHDDPSRRRYAELLQLIFRTAAGLMLVALIALVVGLVRWERRRAARKAAP